MSPLATLAIRSLVNAEQATAAIRERNTGALAAWDAAVAAWRVGRVVVTIPQLGGATVLHVAC